MLVLFDNGTPRTLARYLIDHHTVTEARARGWEELENGELRPPSPKPQALRCRTAPQVKTFHLHRVFVYGPHKG